MTLEERMKLMMALDTLLKRKLKGNPNDYAAKLGISRNTFLRLKEIMKEEFQAPVVYNKVESRYEYEKPGTIFFGFLPHEIIPPEMLKKIGGGTSIEMNLSFSDKIFCPVPILGTDSACI